MAPTASGKWLAGIAAFSLAVFGADRGIARAFEAAMPRAAARGGCGETGEGTVYAALHARAEVVVLGHSRARHNYDTRTLRDRLGTTVFNAGKNGQGLWYSRGLADLLLRSYRPGTIIIDIDPQSIVFVPRNHDALVFLAPHIDDSPVIRSMLMERSTLEPLKYLSRCYRFNSRLVQMIGTASLADPTIDGFRPMARRFDPQRDPDASESWGSAVWTPDAELERTLAALLRETTGAGARVFLVSSPTWRREGGLDPRQPPLIERIEAIALGAGVPWLRVTAESHPEFASPDLFADGTHLNEVGAARFSGIVADWIGGHTAPAPPAP